MWDKGGFAFWIGNFQDMLSNPEANEICADYLRRRIRRTVKDPEVAERLIPKSHYYGTKRQPLDTNYYETFNKDNVLLVDTKTDGEIEEITERGIRAGGKEYEADITVLATGFDAMTGPLKALNLRGRGGRRLEEAWQDGPHTYLGIAVAGFPNLFTITGPQSPSVLTNMPAAIEQHVEWVTDCIEAMRKEGRRRIEAEPEAQEAWGRHVNEVMILSAKSADRWWRLSLREIGLARTTLRWTEPA
jgi:cyclohexanone monooxygenase